MKKVLAFTSIRSDYDLMTSLYRLLQASAEFELKLLVSGAHLSSTYGRSVDLIRQDGYDILLAVETLLDSDSRLSRLKSASLLLQNALDTVAQYQPDCILLAGDREDVIMGALMGGFLEIPTIHFYGGDHTQDGHIDNPVRHATSKLVTAHLVSIDEHRQRLLRLGEPPERIFTIGSIALDRFVEHHPMSRSEIREALNIGQGFDRFALLIFHPVVEEMAQCHLIMQNILEALIQQGIYTFVSAPNTDPGNKHILSLIDQYRQHPLFYFYKNLERDIFLSILKNSRFIIGNSSAGILESASVPIPAINVGQRQQGRKANANVLYCGTSQEAITAALNQATSADFITMAGSLTNLYGDGRSAEKALHLLRTVDFKTMLYKKEDPLLARPEADLP